MTDREEFQQRRNYGLRKRHRHRLEHAGKSCTACDASLGGCTTKRWLSGRRCCDDCTHDTGEAR